MNKTKGCLIANFATVPTAAADKGLVDIHDRRPPVLVPDAARVWMKQDVSGKEAEDIAADGAVSAGKPVRCWRWPQEPGMPCCRWIPVA
ncbi:hypothetical protein CER21_26350 [Klebsiella pneumoniae subsp. pneumoniae]|nr:hypothetical protein CER21_26350 [Klebsiella pneumoniae subsp. pneumoniae]